VSQGEVEDYLREVGQVKERGFRSHGINVLSEARAINSPVIQPLSPASLRLSTPAYTIMISSLLNNEADLGVEQTKLALAFLATLSQKTMADPHSNKTPEKGVPVGVTEEGPGHNQRKRNRYSSGSSEEVSKSLFHFISSV